MKGERRYGGEIGIRGGMWGRLQRVRHPRRRRHLRWWG